MKEEMVNARKEAEKSDILKQAESISDYHMWKQKIDAALAEKEKRAEMFDLVCALISKFQSMSLWQFSVLVGTSMRQSSKIVRALKASGRLILLTEQERGHRYIIVVKS